jgi:predicted Zn-dependent protease with MMP-like domain
VSRPITDGERARFDALVEDAIGSLPARVRELLDEVPLVVLDEPETAMLKDLGIEGDDDEALDEICGLHTGTMLTERSVEHHADLPTVIHMFRRGVVSLAGGWDQEHADERVYEEVRITLLHELGHHFGLDEDGLADLGYD